MPQRLRLSALVSAIPAHIRQPRPLPGETLAQLVIRNHRQEWKNCVERLIQDCGVPRDESSRLLAGQLEITDPRALTMVEQFVNYRLPTHFRTLEGLVDLKKIFAEDPGGTTLIEILWPCERHPHGEDAGEQMAKSMGVRVIQFPTGRPRDMDVGTFLPQVHGDFLWIIPGGSKFMPVLARRSIERVLNYMAASPKRAFYSDNASSVIYRTSALRFLSTSFGSLPADTREMGRLFQQAGFELAVDNDPYNVLCEFERQYGGTSLESHDDLFDHKPWWKRIFGR